MPIRTCAASAWTAPASARAPAGGDARLEFRAADVFSEIPAGGDLYLVKNVLYDWSFDSGLKLLAAARAAMAQTAAAEPGRAAPRLLVVEPLFERDSDAPRALFQKVICEDGTRGLDEAQLRRLIEAARLRVLGVERLETGHSVFECAP
nr:methyltransferase [Lysobacter enzymogenes]